MDAKIAEQLQNAGDAPDANGPVTAQKDPLSEFAQIKSKMLPTDKDVELRFIIKK